MREVLISNKVADFMLQNNVLVGNQPAIIALHAKWLHFSSYWLGEEELPIDHQRVAQSFAWLTQFDQRAQIAELAKCLCLVGRNDENWPESPYKQVEVSGFQGPDIVGLDGKGITFKDTTVFVKVEYKDNLGALTDKGISDQCKDVIDYLDIELHFEDLVVKMTGAFDYEGEPVVDLPHDIQ